jgi:hypothetical protein
LAKLVLNDPLVDEAAPSMVHCQLLIVAPLKAWLRAVPSKATGALPPGATVRLNGFCPSVADRAPEAIVKPAVGGFEANCMVKGRVWPATSVAVHVGLRMIIPHG